MVARRADVLQAAADAIRAERGQGNPAQIVLCAQDITTEAGRAAVFATRNDFDIVVTNAGGPPSGNFRDWEREDWIRAVDANMLTPIALIKATVDAMAERGYGRIINITSSAVKAPIDALGLSNGARSGLTGFVAGLARSGIAAQGVTVNNLLPGAFDTDRLNGLFAAAAQKSGQSVDALAAQRRKGIPAQRFGTPEEFGAVCAFLCSAQAGYINGQNLLVDGGAFAGAF
jgi:3-oxoacyl-[acyl-carrier protein] reductase